MECAFCKRPIQGCASIKCSGCSSHFHLECLSSEQMVPNTNNWMCCKCQLAASMAEPKVDYSTVPVVEPFSV